jgi:hypothetical protein
VTERNTEVNIMIAKIHRTLPAFLLLLTSLTVFSPMAHAGPPLICHPFEIGKAQSLPWGGTAWQAIQPSYDVSRLVADTMTLLNLQTPILVRMETIRRAAIYAVWKTEAQRGGDLRVAQDLLARLESRSIEARGKGQREALALFDLGYLVETYKQALRPEDLRVVKGIDGYATVVHAIRMSGQNAEMEFAAAIIASSPRRATEMDHLRRSLSGVKDGSLLATNLVLHFSDMGKTIDELRARVGL